MAGAVGIEIASLLHKDLHGNDLVPLPQIQLLLNVVRLNFPDFGSFGHIRFLDLRGKRHYQRSLAWVSRTVRSTHMDDKRVRT